MWRGVVSIAFVIDVFSRCLVGWRAAPSVGSVGDAYAHALAEIVIGVFKTEVIHRDEPWRGFEAAGMATLESVAGSIKSAYWHRWAMFCRPSSRRSMTTHTTPTRPWVYSTEPVS